tara:strand:+ start:9065 stop:9436 length:372 start_codon:yes stop_codon:yes gene_type:complete
MDSFLTMQILSIPLTLTFLEIVLGIDKILFVSIIAGKLSDEYQKRAMGIELAMAMILRLVLLMVVSFLICMQAKRIKLYYDYIHAEISGQAIILFLDRLFIQCNNTKEIYEKVELNEDHKHQL